MSVIQFQLRRDTAANWTSANPTLLAGEFGFETDTGAIKLGDGSTAWTSLGYYSTKIRTGSGNPAGGLGVVGDLYIDSADGELYLKTGASTWTLQGNLTGPTGATGATGPPGGVNQFNGRTGNVTPEAADYDSFFLTPSEGNAAYQPLDTQLTEISGLTPSNDDFIQEKGGVLTNRTPTQVTADLIAATILLKGLMSAADKIKVNGMYIDLVSEYGADPTGVSNNNTAFSNAISALPASGGAIYLSPGTYNINAPITVNKPVIFIGRGRSISVIQMTAATGNMFTLASGGAGAGFEQLRLSASSSSLRTAGYAVDMDNIANVYMQQCDILFQHSGVRSNGALQFLDDLNIREMGANAANGQCVLVTGTGDRYLRRLTTDNPTDPTGFSSVRVQRCSSIVMSDCNLINGTNCMDIVPNGGGGTAAASILVNNTFFDSSVIGLNILPATSSDTAHRYRFTNCWFSTHTTAGVRIGNGTIPNANIDSIDFVGCDFYQNPFGLDVLGAAEWSVRASRFAGNTTNAIRIAQGASASSHSFTISDNFIGNGAGFGANGQGINIQAGTYKRYQVLDNRGLDTNTTPGLIDLGAVALADQKNVTNNMGAMLNGLIASRSSVLNLAGNGTENIVLQAPIPANSLLPGNSIRVKLYCQSTGTTALTPRARLGAAGTTGDLQVVNAANTTITPIANVGVVIEMLFTIRTIGGAGVATGVGNADGLVGTSAVAAGQFVPAVTTIAATLNTTVNNIFSVTLAQATVTTAVHACLIEVI